MVGLREEPITPITVLDSLPVAGHESKGAIVRAWGCSRAAQYTTPSLVRPITSIQTP